MEASTVAVPRAAVRRSPRLLRTVSDARLVVLVRAGDAAAFEVVYDRHHRGLLSFCRHMLSSAEEGEDAVQQTFLSAHRNLLGSSRPVQLKPWLYAIARNRCLSMLRARREQATGEEIEVATEGLADEVQRRSDLKELLADLRKLPDGQREALVLAEIGALGHDDIGEVIGVPRAKVKALVFQARESLIASRTARETPCSEIREQLSTLRGSALRRSNLRRHLRDCEGCREYLAHVETQRAALALVIPVVPSLALKHASMPATVAAKLGGGGGAAGGGLTLAGAKGAAVKILAAVALASAGTAGTVVAIDAYGGHVRGQSHLAPHVSASASAPASFVAGSAATAQPASSGTGGKGAPANAGHRAAPGRAASRRAPVSAPAHGHAAAAVRRSAPASSLSRPGRSGTAPGRHRGDSSRAHSRRGTHGRSNTAPGRHRGNSAQAHARHGSQRRSPTPSQTRGAQSTHPQVPSPHLPVPRG